MTIAKYIIAPVLAKFYLFLNLVDEVIAGLSFKIFRHLYCGRVVQKSHLSTPKFTCPHLERIKYGKVSKAKP